MRRIVVGSDDAPEVTRKWLAALIHAGPQSDDASGIAQLLIHTNTTRLEHGAHEHDHGHRHHDERRLDGRCDVASVHAEHGHRRILDVRRDDGLLNLAGRESDCVRCRRQHVRSLELVVPIIGRAGAKLAMIRASAGGTATLTRVLKLVHVDGIDARAKNPHPRFTCGVFVGSVARDKLKRESEARRDAADDLVFVMGRWWSRTMVG